jgi:exodeoxyribonuclease VII large subunit
MLVYEVSQVTSYMKEVLSRDQVLRDLWVSGEVTNLARPGSGHSYFSLRDEKSTIRCVMFRNSRGAELLNNGGAVIAHGRMSVYESRGEVQLYVDIVQPEGVGELQLKLEQLKLKLEQEGLFDVSRKRPLPEFPKKIGVITSPTGAVWHDIQNVIRRRYPLVELAIAPAPVQGEAAAPGIVEAFQAINDCGDVDVIILARGGGSLEDLWPFNEEAVARAIYASRIPVISAVGHETDYTISDFVADHRAPTPSAAAELAVPSFTDLAYRITQAYQSMVSDAQNAVSTRRDTLVYLKHRLDRSGPDLDTLRLKIDDMLRSVSSRLKNDLAVKKARHESLHALLESLSPKDTLRRGYAIVQRSPGNSVVDDAAELGAGDLVSVTLAKGFFDASVTSIRSQSQEG